MAGHWPLILLLALGGVALPLYREGLGVDGVSYLSIAEHYAAGRLDVAVNPYWSPLLSWLLVPFLAAGLEPLLATKLLALLVAAGALVATQALADALGVSRPVRNLLGAAAVPLLLHAALFRVFPDLLSAALLTGAMALLLNAGISRPVRTAFLAGTLGGAAYLAKAFALPAFLGGAAAATLIGLLAVRGAGERRRLAVAGALAVLGCLLVALPWAGLLTLRQGQPTIGTSGSYNFALMAPGSPGGRLDQPGLVPPPHPHAVSAFEDPSRMPAPSWSEAPPTAAAQRLLGNVDQNVRKTSHLVSDYVPVPFVLAIAGLILGWRAGGDALRRVCALAAVCAVYAGGLLLVVVEVRYLWFLALVGIALSGVAVAAAHAWPPLARATGVFALVLLLALPPLVSGLRPSLAPSPDMLMAEQLDGAVGEEVAADWSVEEPVPLCYRLGCRYHGHPAATTPEGIAAELRAAGIDTYLAQDAALPASAGLERRSDPRHRPVAYAVTDPAESGARQ